LTKIIKIVGQLLKKYQIIIRSDENFAKKASFKASIFGISVVVSSIFLVGIVLSFFIWKYIFDNFYLTKMADEKLSLERNLVQMSKKIDQLEHSIKIKDQFTNTFRLYLGKNDTLPQEVFLASDLVKDTIAYCNNKPKHILSRLATSLANTFFISPLSGYKPIDKVDIAQGKNSITYSVKNDEPVVAVADGTVIYTDWTINGQYVLAMRHKNDIISIYKQNSVFLKSKGDMVLVGEALGMLDPTNKQDAQLELEIWHEGSPLDLNQYITFQKH
jgi:hypothetical protein